MTAVTYALSNVKTAGLSNGIVCVMSGQGSSLQTLTETVRDINVVCEISGFIRAICTCRGHFCPKS